MEASNFLSQDFTDITPIERRIYYMSVKAENYDLDAPTDASRFFVQFWVEPDIRGELFATGENCNNLLRITQKYFIKNLK